MILVDASVWIDHLRSADDVMLQLLKDRLVLTHPFVIGEIALGHVRRREEVLEDVRELRRAAMADDEEVLQFIRDERLFGIGYVDAHLLTSAKLTKGASLWTLDRHLRAAAAKLSLAADMP